MTTAQDPSFLGALGEDRPQSPTPNVVVVLLDDVGFAQFSCFGAEIETPAIDKLAANGLRYNRFHVTSICSSSRASLLTGRNHHAVGMGSVADATSAAPGYSSRLPKSAATMARVLRDAGYSTFALGKWHLTPTGERSHAGPFTQWPLGVGFERYYGFLRADTNQWVPNLISDNHSIDPPATPEEGYHVTEDLADQAINMVLDQKHTAPDKPFFMYFGTGAMHAPHQVAQPWIDHYKGRFDDGWEAMRQRVFDRQVAAGIVPEGTELSERPSWIPDWTELDAEDKALFAKMHEVYAGFLSHTDAQIGRIADFLEEIGELDNTMFIVTSDNGASAEGGEVGAVNEHNFTMRIEEDHQANLAAVDEWGGDRGYYHYAWGWAWAGNTPLRLWKRYAWLGGTRTPMVVHWPNGIQVKNEVRSQFCHIVDLMPTILDICGVNAPTHVDGVEQQPIDGASIAATFNVADAANPRDLQYFEMMGSRGIFSNEWKATTDHVSPLLLDEQRLLTGSRTYDEDQWHLFHLPSDFAEAHDVATENPAVIEQLKEQWHDQAVANQVYPLFGGYDPSTPAKGGQARRSSALADPNRFRRRVYRPGGRPITDESMPKFTNGGTTTVLATIGENPSGVLCAVGDWTQGWALFVDHRHLACAVNIAGVETLVRSESPLEVDSAEPVELGFRLTVQEPGNRHSGVDVDLLINNEVVGSGATTHAMPVGMMQVGGTGLSIGFDPGLPVTERYQAPNPFAGVVHHVTIEVPGGPDVDPAVKLAQALKED